MAKVSVVHDNALKAKEEIMSYLHCRMCLREKPADVSPVQWARLSVGITPQGIQVWCVRHNVNVDHMKLTTEPVKGVRITNDCGHDS